MSQGESGTGHLPHGCLAHMTKCAPCLLDQERWSAIVEFAGVMQVTGAALQWEYELWEFHQSGYFRNCALIIVRGHYRGLYSECTSWEH